MNILQDFFVKIGRFYAIFNKNYLISVTCIILEFKKNVEPQTKLKIRHCTRYNNNI